MAEPQQRLASLDTVRGVAVMGILLMNIVNFAMPEAAYFNPRAYGGDHGANLIVYLVNFVFFDGKMRGLFSVLFGASMLLVIDRATERGESPAQVHFNRMGWLLGFGLLHLWLIWHGDILAHYALIGMFAFLFRNLPTHRTVILGVFLVLTEVVVLGAIPLTIYLAENAEPGARSADSARLLAQFQLAFGVPPAEAIAGDLAQFRGGYAAILATRFAQYAWSPFGMVFLYGPETLAYMLFGMAGLRSGMLRGEWPRRRYWIGLAIGFGIGIPGYALIAADMIAQGFSLSSVAFAAMGLTTLLRPPMIVGWACLILLLMRPGSAMCERIAAAGRMAFSNYLFTSLICTTIFYGYGLGWYGYLDRAELYGVVALVWGAMLLWSRPWLARFRYGPLEWLWRSFSRRSLQPLRGAAA